MPINTTTVSIIFLVAGILQGILLMAYMLSRPTRRDPQMIYLLLLIGAFWFQMVFKVLDKAQLLTHYNYFYCLTFELPFVYGPLMYGYIRHTTQRDLPLLWKETYHLFPFAFMTTILSIFAVTESEWCLMFFFPTSAAHGVIHLSLQILSLGIYAVWSWRAVHTATLTTADRLWYKRFIAVVGLTGLLIVVVSKFLFYNFPDYNAWRMIFIALVLVTYWISFRAIASPDRLGITSFIQKYRKTDLDPAEGKRLATELMRLLDHEKAYLEPEITLDALAGRLGTQKHLLSRVINENLGHNFYELMQSYRVKHATQILTDRNQGHLSIAAVGFESGFNSISSFNAAFKKMTGLTPSAFRESQSAA